MLPPQMTHTPCYVTGGLVTIKRWPCVVFLDPKQNSNTLKTLRSGRRPRPSSRQHSVQRQALPQTPFLSDARQLPALRLDGASGTHRGVGHLGFFCQASTEASRTSSKPNSGRRLVTWRGHAKTVKLLLTSAPVLDLFPQSVFPG